LSLGPLTRLFVPRVPNLRPGISALRRGLSLQPWSERGR